ncbi:MAG: hypothetical protein REI78_00105 [Pedobacter sp.]|nr:hypothetical protein [Pedobacter sp.]
MNSFNTSPTAAFGVSCAKYSFLIGSILFLAYIVSEIDFILPLGLLYVIMAAILNTIVLLVLFLSLILGKEPRLKTLLAIGLMLLNIPVVVIYLHYIN